VGVSGRNHELTRNEVVIAMSRACRVAFLTGILSVPFIRWPPLLLAAQGPGFRSGIDVIAMNVTVTHQPSHRLMLDLAERDFQIFEDGRPQQMTLFQRDNLPLALSLLIDTSVSMQPHMVAAQQAAIGFLRALRPTDVTSITAFDARITLRQDFTSDRAALEHAIPQTAAGRSTALYNAVYASLKALAQPVNFESLADERRKAMIILSDGEDTSSLITFDQLLDCAARSDVVIYTIGLRGRPNPLSVSKPEDPDYVLRHLAEQTGGRSFFATEARELTGVYSEIRTELANQYFLAYASNNPRRDGRFRHIAVRVDRGGAVTRARQGYYAPAK